MTEAERVTARWEAALEAYRAARHNVSPMGYREGAPRLAIPPPAVRAEFRAAWVDYWHLQSKERPPGWVGELVSVIAKEMAP